MNRLMSAVLVGSVTGLLFTAGAFARETPRPPDPAGKYMVSVVRDKIESRYSSAWETLYPPHQRVASLEAYVACESLVPSPGTLVGVKALRIFNETIHVAGQRLPISTRAVKVRVSVASPLVGLIPVVIVQTFHAVRVSRHWTWILSSDQYANYSAGACPYS
jgi:hypothetical protein